MLWRHVATTSTTALHCNRLQQIAISCSFALREPSMRTWELMAFFLEEDFASGVTDSLIMDIIGILHDVNLRSDLSCHGGLLLNLLARRSTPTC